MANSLSAFLGEIGRHQLLTPEEELMMGRKVQAMLAIINQGNPEGASERNREYTDEELKKSVQELSE